MTVASLLATAAFVTEFAPKATALAWLALALAPRASAASAEALADAPNAAVCLPVDVDSRPTETAPSPFALALAPPA